MQLPSSCEWEPKGLGLLSFRLFRGSLSWRAALILTECASLGKPGFIAGRQTDRSLRRLRQAVRKPPSCPKVGCD